jgi:hypothetical protein
VFINASGQSDPFYKRFTTSRQNSLILGTSRAAQGILPIELKRILSKDIFNFSFTVSQSPFGPTYLNAIKKKLNTDIKNGIFIITIDPWSISSTNDNPDDLSSFRELKLCLANTSTLNTTPNFNYLINSFNDKYYKLLYNYSSMFLHDDGWLEISVDMDTEAVRKRIDRKINSYKKNTLPFYKFSKLRLNYLIKTIDYLSNHGEVYLVRLPMHPKMMEIENQFMPDFESKIFDAKIKALGYLDMTKLNSKFDYTDGNHLYKESGRLVSKLIAKWIAEKEKSNCESQNDNYQ